MKLRTNFLAFLLQFFFISAVVAQNPVLPGFHADPEILYSNKTKKYYIYSTTDGQPGWGGWYFTAFSSTDLKSWKDEGTMLDLKSGQVPWANGNAWAPCIEEKLIDGAYKYFFYYSGNPKEGGGKQIGVAISDSPTGPFTDLGHPIITASPTGGGQQIDVDVFTDPASGKSYLYWGNGYMAGAELNPDMVSIKKETITVMTPRGGTLQDYAYREAPYVFYRNGLYYFTWSVDDTGSPNYHVAYGTSKSPLGPLEVAKPPVILIQNPEKGIYGPAHNAILQVPGTDEWHIVYHRINKNYLKDAPGIHREVCIDRMEFNKDGSIRQVVPTTPPVTTQNVIVNGPDGKLQLTVLCPEGGEASYSLSYNGKQMLESSPLGLETNVGDFAKTMKLIGQVERKIDTVYTQSRIKASRIHYRANELVCSFINNRGQKVDVTFRVGNNDVAFRYTLSRQGETGSIAIDSESTGFRFPARTTTFLSPQSDAMIGWKRTKPSYEEEYKVDTPMNTRSQYGHGYTFPCLFKVGEDGWVLVSETGVDSRYCGSRLSDVTEGNLYTIAFPMPEENNGNGTVAPAFALPGSTPWRTITVGETLNPIVETTVPWDVVEPLYKTEHNYRMGRGTWSWILWQDGSINYDDQVRYVDLAVAMGYEYVLIDNWWDTNIGHERMEQLIKYAHSKGVDVFLWYSSSGYWNDIEQGPTNLMDNLIVRKREMKWLQSQGVKGIKVDFFGGDKQETMRLYESILSDADDHGLMVIFHGCTLPRGWERMYPNYVGSEAVLASENLFFNQRFCDEEAFNATLHPFIRNTVGSMEFGGCFLNKRLNKGNDGGTTRRTTDVFQLATAVLFQNPIQNFALAPNNLTDVPPICLDFMKHVPTVWDETRFIDGYPGKYTVLARRQGKRWYIAAINATKEPLKLKLDLPMIAGETVALYSDDKQLQPQLQQQKVKADGKLQLIIQPQGGVVLHELKQ